MTAAVAAAFTLLVSIGSVLSFAYRNVPLDAAAETAAALISIVAAQLAWGRFRQSLSRGDLLLAGSLAVFAAANLLFSAIPAISDSDPGSFATWAPAGGRLLGAALLAASAVVADQVLRHPTRDARRLLVGIVVALGVLTLAVAVGGDALPKAVPADLSPIGGSQPRVVGNPVVLTSELLSMLLFAVAAIGYARAADVRHDVFAYWLAVAATLGGVLAPELLPVPLPLLPLLLYRGRAAARVLRGDRDRRAARDAAAPASPGVRDRARGARADRQGDPRRGRPGPRLHPPAGTAASPPSRKRRAGSPHW